MPAAHMPWKTAIRRKGPSAPVRWLYRNGYLDVSRLLDPPIKDPRILDFGGGHGADTDWLRGKPELLPYRIDSWDLYHRQDDLCNPYDIVLCTYVANVLPREERAKLFWDLLSSMRGLHGRAYITVRRDGEGQCYTSTGSFQDYEVDLVQEWNDMGDFVPSVRLVHETSAFAIFELSNYHD